MTDTIYNDAIVAAAKSRTGAGRLEHPTATVTCDNPLCGDRTTLDLATASGRVTALAHKTRGCLLTEAAAAVIARHAPGERAEALAAAADAVRAFLEDGAAPPWPELAMFEPVRQVRSRHECVLLPFAALREAVTKVGAGVGH
jgi:nitrogen fixation NifU-like protein